MGRPRRFDLDRATAIATDLFWRHGYDGTSIGELTRAIGINAPSFYCAFGSKEALFSRIIATYLDRQRAIVDAAFAETDARALVATLLAGFGAFLAAPDHAPGCLILNSALPIDEGHPFRAEWAEGRRMLRETLAGRFRADREGARGFPAEWDPDAAARLVYALVWGIAVEAHSGADAASIQRMIDQFLAMWPDGAVGDFIPRSASAC